MLYFQYLVLALLVVVLSVKLSYYVDCLDKKTNLSGAFIGGVLLAAVTSLPELFTSLTAVLALDQPDLVQGNVLGSNIFNLCVIGGIVLFTSKRYQRATLSNSHHKTVWYGIMMYLLVVIAMCYPMQIGIGIVQINLMSIFIFILYLISVKFMGKDTSADTQEDENIVLSVKQISIRFLMYSVGLIAVSILLTQVSDKLAVKLNLEASVAGAIFLGIATSLPELSASINLVRIGNFNASFGNVLGSNLFNFIILCFADIIYLKGGIYAASPSVVRLLGFGLFTMFLSLILIYYKKKRSVALLCSMLILLSYVINIAISM